MVGKFGQSIRQSIGISLLDRLVGQSVGALVGRLLGTIIGIRIQQSLLDLGSNSGAKSIGWRRMMMRVKWQDGVIAHSVLVVQ